MYVSEKTRRTEGGWIDSDQEKRNFVLVRRALKK
jgi:hypothetical protein